MALKQVEIGSKLGKYRLVQKLGQGGMGMVYQAVHEKLGKDVALKILPMELSLNETHVERFFREMQAVGQLEHPNVVRAFDADEHEGIHFLVMECVDGIDLAKFVQLNGPLPTSDACEIIRQTALGLSAIDKAGLIHRDIKASNLIMDRSGVVKILDLGLVRSLKSDGNELTPTGQGLGTVDYLAPEQGDSARRVDIRSDIYSLGCTLYKLVTGQAPFSGLGFETLPEKIMAHSTKPVPPFPESISGVPDEVFSIIKKMMEKSPTNRYQKPDDVVEALSVLSGGAQLELLAEKMPAKIVPPQVAGAEKSSVSLLGPEIGTVDFPQKKPEFSISGVGPIGETRIDPLLQTHDIVSQDNSSGNIWHRHPLFLLTVIIFSGIFALTIHNATRSQLAEVPHALFAPGEVENSKLDPKARPNSKTPKLVSLDDEIPFRWRRVLETEPVPLIWKNKQGLAKWNYDAEQQLLHITSDSDALFSMGITSLDNYQLQIGMEQLDWNSGGGIFFGYKIVNQPDGGKKTSFHLLRTMVKPSHEPGLKLIYIRRVRAEFIQFANGQVLRNFQVVATQLVPHGQVGELLVDLEIKEGKLRTIKVRGVFLADLISESINKQFQPDSCSGEFGAYTNSCSTNYQNAMFRKLPQ